MGTAGSHLQASVGARSDGLDRHHRRIRPAVVQVPPVQDAIAAEVLRSYGFRVSAFQSGLNAIRQLSFDKVDAVLTDINMPGMSGTEIICLVRDVWEAVGIVAMSADERAGRKCENADAFLLKPFGPEELVNTVKKVMGFEIESLEC